MEKKERIIGIWHVLIAYTSWGLLPIYWKLLKPVPASQILAHRIFWSFVFVAWLLIGQKRWFEFKNTFSSARNRLTCILTAAIIASNWFIYIWAVNAGHIVDASLGYFINPLISVLLGVVFLRERLKFWQVIAVVLAFIGVSYMTFQYGRIPWISLSLALTFGFYGLLRKTARIESLVGLSAETALLSPLVLSFIVFQQIKGSGVLGTVPLYIHFLLLGAGVVTATPLLWFTHGVRKIPLSTAGFLQYIAPSLQLFLGVIVYSEPFTTVHLISFGFIWIALVIFSFSQTTFMLRLQPKLFREKALE
ncbi:MAG: EamA family transporter RarD [Promethearchaeota archaeon]